MKTGDPTETDPKPPLSGMFDPRWTPLSRHPAPWRLVMHAEVYTGPRGGWRVCMTLNCGHTMSRQASAAERQSRSCSTSTARCWVCWWKLTRPPGTTPDHYHR